MKSNITFDFELEAKNQGYSFIVGVDEAGAGCLAGPLVAAAVNIPDGFDYSEIKDSKELSVKKREILAVKILNECRYSIVEVDNKLIDEINILNARKLAFRMAINDIDEADFALIDGNALPTLVTADCKAIINGDKLSASIAAASILAKVHRDEIMKTLHIKYPQYGWDRNKGYGTKLHRDMIAKFGPCEWHRKSFSGVKEWLK